MQKLRLMFAMVLVFSLTACGPKEAEAVRLHHHIDFDWRFIKSDPAGAQAVDFDDSQWDMVDLPHDWMIAGPVDKDNPSGTAGGFYPGGIGWYRKALHLSKEQQGKKLYLHFDGIYRNATVWVNGKEAGQRANGYISYYYDITPYVVFDTTNMIAVRVDGSVQPMDRWYSGCGIYRHVWLTATSLVHVPVWGMTVTTPEISKNQARVVLKTNVKNDDNLKASCRLVTTLLDPNAVEINVGSVERLIAPGNTEYFEQEVTVNNPQLWDVNQPNLYQAIVLVYSGEKLKDQYKTTFGIREAVFSSNSGLIINGKKVLLKGVCLHHDGGNLGAAVPNRVWERRLKILKDMGVNAVRLAHNPHAPEVLDLCDRMGILVFDEAFDKWRTAWQKEWWEWPDSLITAYQATFDNCWKQDLTDFIERDKNHPSVIIWSVGNETIEQLHAPEEAAQIQKQLIDLVHRMDPTRPATCGLHPGNPRKPSHLIHSMDVVSYNYRTQDMVEWHKVYPDYSWISSETKAYRTDAPKNWADIDYTNNSWFYLDDFVAGQFIWAGIDYLGESRGWPDKGIRSGIIFTTGFKKPHAHFTRSIYADQPMVHIVVFDDNKYNELSSTKTWQESWYGPPVSDHWSFPESKGRTVQVLTYTNCDSVELILNETALGIKALQDYPDRVIRWQVPYQEGIIRALGKMGGQTVCTHRLVTAGKPAKIQLEADRTSLKADGKDVSHITARVVDEQGIRVPRTNNKIHFVIAGNAKILAIDNGDMSDHSDPVGAEMECRDGRLLLIIQAGRTAGQVTIQAESSNLVFSELTLLLQ